jgi:uracil phosphoribosyltransferase
MVFNLSEQNSIANQFLAELRDRDIQRDRMRFRKNMERLGEIMAYEVSKKLQYGTRIVEGPLDKTRINVLKQEPLLVAGLPYFQGFINVFDRADAAFVGAYRDEFAHELTVRTEYITTPALTGREVILVDPMLATGRSATDAINLLTKKGGQPQHLHVVALVAAPEGIKQLAQHVNVPYSLWTCAIDESLNDKFYIVPGLGDAGDLSYGTKL